MTDLTNTEERIKEYAIGVTFVTKKWDMFIFSSLQLIYCPKCWDTLVQNGELFPNYDEVPMTVLLTFPYTCAECKATIYPESVAVIGRKLQKEEKKR